MAAWDAGIPKDGILYVVGALWIPEPILIERGIRRYGDLTFDSSLRADIARWVGGSIATTYYASEFIQRTIGSGFLYCVTRKKIYAYLDKCYMTSKTICTDMHRNRLLAAPNIHTARWEYLKSLNGIPHNEPLGERLASEILGRHCQPLSSPAQRDCREILWLVGCRKREAS